MAVDKICYPERETKFTSQVYDVLNRVVNRIDEFNYLRYKQEMNEQIGEIKNYNDLIASQQGGTSSEWYSNNLFNILNNDINRLKGERSYLFSVVPYARSGIGKKMDQEFIEQTIRSMELPQRDSTARAARLAQFSQQMQEFLIRLLHEKIRKMYLPNNVWLILISIIYYCMVSGLIIFICLSLMRL